MTQRSYEFGATGVFGIEKEIMMPITLRREDNYPHDLPEEFRYPTTVEPSESFWDKAKSYFTRTFLSE